MSDRSLSRNPVDSLRRPEYTGENRCVPCTVVNVGLATLAAVAVAVLSVPAAAATFAFGLATIYLRGYLVPYTPTLTRRYLPDRVLRLFDKSPAGLSTDGEDVDVSALLQSLGVVQPCEDRDDLCLTADFERSWRERAAAIDGDDDRRAAVADLLDVDAAALDLREHGSAVVLRHEGRNVGQWESTAALEADLAADRALASLTPDWSDLDPLTRSRVLNTLRMFLETCPACGGPATLGRDTVESCCRSIDVAAVTCEDCESRLFEVELSGGGVAEAEA